MKSLIYCRPSAITSQASQALEGTLLYAQHMRLYGAGTIPIDRSGTIRTPLNTRLVRGLPTFRPQPKSLETICDDRAREILAQAERLDCRIYCLWSGGIDSTLVLVSLLKQATEQQKARLCVLISSESLIEYRRFFYDHIHTKLSVVTSSALPTILGSRDILVSGEGNDLLFGADIMVRFIADFGPTTITETYDRAHVSAVFGGSLHDPAITDFYVTLYERLLPAAPIPLTTTFDFLWWTSFCLKWQSIAHRMLTYTAPERLHTIDRAYVEERYIPFFMTEDFELWSLNNHDKKIRDTWESYKWPCKEIIYAYTHDAEYLATKTKHGSLGSLLRYRNSAVMVQSDFTVSTSMKLTEYYVAENDFRVR